MDLDISMRTSDCPYTVHFYGAMFREGDVMICMEVMDISLDKFYARAFNKNKSIPEDVLGKVAFAVSFLLFSLSTNRYLQSCALVLEFCSIYLINLVFLTKLFEL